PIAPVGPAAPCAPAGPGGPVTPDGIVKFRTAADGVPLFVTDADEPGPPVTVFPIAIVPATPPPPLSSVMSSTGELPALSLLSICADTIGVDMLAFSCSPLFEPGLSTQYRTCPVTSIATY